MKMNEIQEMPVAELQDKGRQLRKELFELNLQKGIYRDQFKRAHRIREVRKDIARVETALTGKKQAPVEAN